MGIAFARADGTTPAAVFWGLGSRSLPNSPFSVTEVQPGILVVEDRITLGQNGRRPDGKEEEPDCVTYKFSVIIQRLSDGAIGVIDPYIENAN